VTLQEFLDLHKKHKRTACQAALDALLGEKQITRIGLGKKGDPYRYFRPVEDSAGTEYT
jgi:hypothetical protein